MQGFLKGVCLLLLAAILAGCYTTKVPDRSVSSVKRSKPAAKAKAYRPEVYTVRANDTLYSIGKRFGVDYRQLARRNRIRPPYDIYIGQHIYLRGVPPLSQSLPLQKNLQKKKVVKKKGTKKVAKARSNYKAKAGGYTALIWPIRGKITSRFGRRGSRMHDGIDISAKEGTPVRAASSGTVVYSDQRLSGYGKLVIIRHGKNLFTVYAHNRRNLVKKGARVKRGDTIARVGQTGRANGPHLHFEVRHGGTAVDPLSYLPRR